MSTPWCSTAWCAWSTATPSGLPRRDAFGILLPAGLAALELSHPAWSDGSISQAVSGAGGWWMPLHGLLIVGYALLTVTLWRDLPRTPSGTLARALLAAFGVCNTLFVGVDGLAVGLLAATNPTGADAVWNGPLVTTLANLTGATWSAALLSVAYDRYAVRAGRGQLVGLGLIWLTFLTSAALPAAGLVSRVLAIGTGAWTVYRSGSVNLPFAVMMSGAVLRQHVGGEAALGLVCLAIARGLLLRERSAPGVGSPP